MAIDQLLHFAVKHGISDVHLRSGRPAYFRRDGQLVTRKGASELSEGQLIQWFNAMTSERHQGTFVRLAEVDFGYNLEGAGRFRVNAFKERGRMAMVLRHIPLQVPRIEDLGLPQVVADLALSQRGIILVTGATGSGKSTTMAAMVQVVNANRACHVLTIEDPIEFVFEDDKAVISQREVGSDTASFTPALKAALRQDPDVILLGELRDLLAFLMTCK